MMVAYSSKGCEPDHADEWLIGATLAIVVIICIGAALTTIHENNDTDPEYEIEMSDGTVYKCNKLTAHDDGTTKLKNINGTKEDVTVFTHLIVRSERIL